MNKQEVINLLSNKSNNNIRERVWEQLDKNIVANILLSAPNLSDKLSLQDFINALINAKKKCYEPINPVLLLITGSQTEEEPSIPDYPNIKEIITKRKQAITAAKITLKHAINFVKNMKNNLNKLLALAMEYPVEFTIVYGKISIDKAQEIYGKDDFIERIVTESKLYDANSK